MFEIKEFNDNNKLNYIQLKGYFLASIKFEIFIFFTIAKFP